MALIRRSYRVCKARDYWDPTNSPPHQRHPHQRHPPVFTIYTERSERLEHLTEGLTEGLTEDLSTELSDNDLSTEFSDEDRSFELSDEDLSPELDEDLSPELDEDLSPELDEDLSPELDEDLSPELDEDLSPDLDEDLSLEPDEDLSLELDEDLSLELDKDLSEHLSRQLHESLGVDPPYQPQFLPKDRAGKPQNLPEDSDPVKLFQLFFTIKEIKNIVKQTNQRAIYIDFKYPWKSLTVTEAYRYLGCLVYIGIQPLRELDDHWQLKSPIASCFSQRRFKQIRHAFTVRDPNTSPEQPEDPWWFRVEPLASTIRQACQKYWIPGAHLAVDECMIPYFGHTRHTIKAPHKPIKQGYKLWALGDHGYIFNWLWYSKNQGTESLGLRSRSRSRSSNSFMADTQALVISLAKSLPLAQDYILYLDNLFTNVPLANALRELGIGVMGTTRATASGLPLSLIQLKHAKESLKWGYLETAIAKKVLCFLWQDNNRVLGMIIAYNYFL